MNSDLTLDINALVELTVSQWRETVLRRNKARVLVTGVLRILAERIYGMCSGREEVDICVI